MPDAANEPVNIFHHTLRRGGGKERYALALAGALRRLGRQVTFYCMEAEKEAAASVGVEVRLLPVPKRPRKLQDYRFHRQVQAARRSAVGVEIGLSRVAVRDVHVSGGTHRGHLASARKFCGPFDCLRIWLERKAYGEARVIVAHSDLLAKQLVSLYGMSKSKVRTLYAPVDDRFLPPRISASRPELRTRFGFPPDQAVFLFPSSGHGRKGLTPVLKAVGAYPGQARVFVAGKAECRAASCGYLGYVENLAEAYYAADFTILGSYYEPFGLVGPESLLCGTRLVFEENIGCLAAVREDYVIPFSVWDESSIRGAVQKAIALFKAGAHRDVDASKALKYDPSPLVHARAILRFLAEAPEPREQRA